MSLLTVLKDNHPILRKKSQPVSKVTPEIQATLRDMIETIQEYNGVGLAAPQIGINQRFVVVGSLGSKRYPDAPVFPIQILINPQIKPITSKKLTDTEGCLSVPGWYGPVPRYCQIKVSALDIDGKKINFKQAVF